MIIDDLRGKIKGLASRVGEYEQEIWVTLVVIMVCALVFGTGRLLWLDYSRAPIKVYNSAPDELQKSQNMKVFASSKGSKYYLPWCKSTIKAANKIEFQTEAAALAAGYQKAKGCK